MRNLRAVYRGGLWDVQQMDSSGDIISRWEGGVWNILIRAAGLGSRSLSFRARRRTGVGSGGGGEEGTKGRRRSRRLQCVPYVSRWMDVGDARPPPQMSAD